MVAKGLDAGGKCGGTITAIYTNPRSLHTRDLKRINKRQEVTSNNPRLSVKYASNTKAKVLHRSEPRRKQSSQLNALIVALAVIVIIFVLVIVDFDLKTH